jgi:hypothetical protein
MSAGKISESDRALKNYEVREVHLMATLKLL